jgi:hypothetical protein
MCPFRNHIRTWQWVLSRQDENGGKGPVSLFLDRQRVDFVHRRQGRRANDLPQHAELRAGPRSGNYEPGYQPRDKVLGLTVLAVYVTLVHAPIVAHS